MNLFANSYPAIFNSFLQGIGISTAILTPLHPGLSGADSIPAAALPPSLAVVPQGRRSRYLLLHRNGIYKALCAVLLLLIANLSFAIDDHQFADPAQQKTYESIIAELRCLVCQNQTIADSNAELASDLRRQVYEMLQQGKSKDDITQFMTERYGDFVLYNPPFKAKTGLLWLGPIAFLLTGTIMIAFVIRRKKTAQTKGKTEIIDTAKHEKIRRLLQEDTDKGEQP